MSLLGGFGWAVRVLSGDSPSRVGGGRYGAGMEKRGVVVGFASAVLAVGMAFGGMAIANAQESPAVIEPTATPAAGTVEPMSEIGTAVADTPAPVVVEVPVVVAVVPEPVPLAQVAPAPASVPAAEAAVAPVAQPVAVPSAPVVDPRPADAPLSMTPWINPLDTTRPREALCYGAPEGYTGILVGGLVPAADGRDCIPAPGFDNGRQDANGVWVFGPQ